MSRPPTDPHIMNRHLLRVIAGALGALMLTLGCARAEFGAVGAEQVKQRWCSEIGARLHSVSGKFCARSGLMPSALTSVDGRALIVLDRRPTPPPCGRKAPPHARSGPTTSLCCG